MLFVFSVTGLISQISLKGTTDLEEFKYAFENREQLLADEDLELRGGTNYNLGLGYLHGWEPVKKNLPMAAYYFGQGAKYNNKYSQYNLGHMYYLGDGVPENKKTAVKWFLKAAEQGNAKSQGTLGAMYLLGDGVLEDYVKGYAWSITAKANGADVQHVVNSAKSKMTADQIAAGQLLAKELFERIEKQNSENPADNPINLRFD